MNKFSTSSKVWVKAGQYYFRRDDPTAARALLKRALRALARRKHIAVITSFALVNTHTHTQRNTTQHNTS